MPFLTSIHGTRVEYQPNETQCSPFYATLQQVTATSQIKQGPLKLFINHITDFDKHFRVFACKPLQVEILSLLKNTTSAWKN